MAEKYRPYWRFPWQSCYGGQQIQSQEGLMKRSGVAIVAAATLALAACSKSEENATNLENVATSNLDELANETANQAEAETLANQQAELENQDSADNATNEVTPTEDPDENVSGM
jgi:hypothetical protein